MPRTKASIDAQNRYDAKSYDKVLLRLPKGTKDRIVATGATVNGFITRAVLEKLESINTTEE